MALVDIKLMTLPSITAGAALMTPFINVNAKGAGEEIAGIQSSRVGGPTARMTGQAVAGLRSRFRAVLTSYHGDCDHRHHRHVTMLFIVITMISRWCAGAAATMCPGACSHLPLISF
jgi:hypothetical protein